MARIQMVWWQGKKVVNVLELEVPKDNGKEFDFANPKVPSLIKRLTNADRN